MSFKNVIWLEQSKVSYSTNLSITTEGLRDWQNLFAITRFLLSRFFFIYFTITGAKTKLFVIPRTSLYRSSTAIVVKTITNRREVTV